MNTDDKLDQLARETFIELHRRGPLTPDEEGRIIRSALEQAYDAGYVRREQDIQNLCICGNLGPEQGIPSPLCPVHKHEWSSHEGGEMNTDQIAAEAEQLARTFHNIYDRLASEFEYETRKETREFDPTTPNGRLMIAVCAEIQSTVIKAAIEKAEQSGFKRGLTFYERNQKTGEILLNADERLERGGQSFFDKVDFPWADHESSAAQGGKPESSFNDPDPLDERPNP